MRDYIICNNKKLYLWMKDIPPINENKMKKILFVNACIRENSRTEELCRQFLKRTEEKYLIEEVALSQMDLKPIDAAALKQRDRDISSGNLDNDRYRLAHQFSEADSIVIAAPYWDCLFPAILRIYLEQICVTDITFSYSEDGALVKRCRADSLTYITTCGGFLPERSAPESLIREMGRLFSIEKVDFYAAEGLDIFPEKAHEILNQTLKRMIEG